VGKNGTLLEEINYPVLFGVTNLSYKDYFIGSELQTPPTRIIS
jgi:uncharacterized membrane protein YdjX (TVP38/TMEM64 family)